MKTTKLVASSVIALASTAILSTHQETVKAAPAVSQQNTTQTTSSALGAVTINYKPGASIAVWNSPYQTRRTTGSFLKHNTSWKYFKTVTVDNEIWYNLGGDQWIPNQYTFNADNAVEIFKDTVKVTYQKSAIAVWNSPFTGRKTTGAHLNPNTSWKTFKRTKINNEYWYNLGGDQWVPGEYVAIKEDNTTNNTTTDRNARIQKVVNTAKAQIGTPYAWGAATPGVGFDCSGLTTYAYASINVNLPHQSGQQATRGTRVSTSSLQAGDLMFWSNGSSVYHVAMYIGNGQMIHAIQPGDTVRVTSTSFMGTPSSASRII